MRVLIVATILACAAASPSGLLAAPYSAGIISHAGLAVAHAAPLALAPAVPTISSGDINGAAIDAHVQASDHVRAAVDQANEIQGKAIDAAVDNSWQAVNAVQTAQAQLDGAAAGVSPVLAKQLVSPAIATYAAPTVAAYAAPAVAAYSAPAVAAYSAPAITAYAAPAYAASRTVVSQSLSQTHPAPLAFAAPIAYAYGVRAW